jgi:quercetin dioxygenase-like cupin family protein
MSEPLHNPETGQTIRVVSETPDLLVMESDYRAGSTPPPPHLHPTQVERFEVLSGGVWARVDGVERTLTQGDVLEVPAGAVHEFGGLPDVDGTVRWEVRPALRTRQFHEAIFGLAGSPTDSRSLIGAALIAKEFKQEFRLAKPGPKVQAVLFASLGLLGKLRRRG